MKTKRSLRLSGFNDYLAIDIVDEQGKILSTPFYLRKGEIKQVKYKDQEELKLYRSDVWISSDFTQLMFCDAEGLRWESDFKELLDEDIIRFITPTTN